MATTQLAPTTAQAPSASSPSPYTPGKNPLQIGYVFFNSVECPSELPIGAVEQKVAVTEYIGGGRVAQSMGAQPQQVTWKGTLFDTMVAPRVKALRALCVSGQEVFLAWHTEQYYCKIIKFTPTYRHVNMCDYEITVEITRDSNGALSAPDATSIDQQVSSLLSTSNSLYPQLVSLDPNAASLQSSLQNMQIAVQNAGPLAQTAGTTASSVLSAINTTLTDVTTYVGGLSKTDSQYITAFRLLNLLNLMYQNVQRGQNPRSITVQGTNLIEICAQYYGDYRLAFALAAANSLATPLLPSAQANQIALPPFASK